MLSENRISKYLLYATGEILLVMIGILLALQVNTWNEQRKLRQQELDALVEVRADLVSTMWDINNNLQIMRESLTSAWTIKRLINTAEVFPDSLGPDLYKLTQDEFLYVVSKTYSTLKSAGFRLIQSEEIQRKLDYLYELSYPRVQMATSIEPDIQAYFTDYVKNNIKAVPTDSLYISGRDIKELSRSELFRAGRGATLNYAPIAYAHFKEDAEFRLLLENSIRWRLMKIFRYKTAMESTQETIDLIENYLSGKIKLPPIRNLAYLSEKEDGFVFIIDIINKGDTDDHGYDISEAAINNVGYRLIDTERTMDALKIIKLNTELYPDAYNTYDSYGEILLLTGDTVNAIKAYKKSLELNPDNENATKVLSEVN